VCKYILYTYTLYYVHIQHSNAAQRVNQYRSTEAAELSVFMYIRRRWRRRRRPSIRPTPLTPRATARVHIYFIYIYIGLTGPNPVHVYNILLQRISKRI